MKKFEKFHVLYFNDDLLSMILDINAHRADDHTNSN